MIAPVRNRLRLRRRFDLASSFRIKTNQKILRSLPQAVCFSPLSCARFQVQADIINTDNLVKRMRRELALLPPELHGFIELMLKADPLTRLTAKQALSHAFLRTPDDNGWRQVVQRAMDNALKVST